MESFTGMAGKASTEADKLAEKLAKLGTVYVNDAFGTAHRAHASTAVIAKFFPAEKRMFGLLMEGEPEAVRADPRVAEAYLGLPA